MRSISLLKSSTSNLRSGLASRAPETGMGLLRPSVDEPIALKDTDVLGIESEGFVSSILNNTCLCFSSTALFIGGKSPSETSDTIGEPKDDGVLSVDGS